MTKAVTGGVAFAVGKSLDVNPRVKLGKLPVKVRHRLARAEPSCFMTAQAERHRPCRPPRQVEVGASIYKEGADSADAGADDVLCLKIKAVNAIIAL